MNLTRRNVLGLGLQAVGVAAFAGVVLDACASGDGGSGDGSDAGDRSPGADAGDDSGTADAGDNGGADAGGQDETCANGARATSISANHGHALTVDRADVLAGAEKTYSIRGTATHDHQVTLTAGDFAQLAAGAPAIEVSTVTAGHSHTVTVNCT